jgi:hypothetical protein
VAVGGEQVRVETASARVVGKECRTNRELLASNRNALNVERLWHGSSHGSSGAWIFKSHAKEKGHRINVQGEYLFTGKILWEL